MDLMSLTIIDWGSLADWVSVIGALAAAVVLTLYVARFSQRVRLRGYCGRRLIVGRGRPQIDVLAVSVTNISLRPTEVINIVFTCGIWRWKRHVLVKFMQDMGHNIPQPLSDGETGYWYVPMGESNNFARGLIDGLKITRFSVATLRVQILTSNGGTTMLWPEKSFRDTLMSLVKEKKSGQQ